MALIIEKNIYIFHFPFSNEMFSIRVERYQNTQLVSKLIGMEG